MLHLTSFPGGTKAYFPYSCLLPEVEDLCLQTLLLYLKVIELTVVSFSRNFSHGCCSSLDRCHFLCISLRIWKHFPCLLEKIQHYVGNDLIY